MSALDRLAELESAATPGQWRLADGYGALVSDDPEKVARMGEDNLRGYGGGLVGESIELADREFLVAARNALPALIAVAPMKPGSSAEVPALRCNSSSRRNSISSWRGSISVGVSF